MTRPDNPYRKGSVMWAVMEGGLQGGFDGLPGWDDLTIRQIAEVLDTRVGTVQQAMSRIKAQTGYTVPHVAGGKGGGGQ